MGKGIGRNDGGFDHVDSSPMTSPSYIYLNHLNRLNLYEVNKYIKTQTVMQQ